MVNRWSFWPLLFVPWPWFVPSYEVILDKKWDGDTWDVYMRGDADKKLQRIRLSGIDALESSQKELIGLSAGNETQEGSIGKLRLKGRGFYGRLLGEIRVFQRDARGVRRAIRLGTEQLCSGKALLLYQWSSQTLTERATWIQCLARAQRLGLGVWSRWFLNPKHFRKQD